MTNKAVRVHARTTVVTVAALLLAEGVPFAIGSAAHAQTLRVQKPFTLTLGTRLSTGGLHRPFDKAQPFDNLDTVYFYAGFTYAFAKSSTANPGKGYAMYQGYVDYATRQVYLSYATEGGGDNGDGGDNLRERSVGIGPSVAFHFGGATAPVHPFVGVGLGYYSVKVYDESPMSRFGGKVFAGLELKCGFLGELDYTRIGEVGGVDTGGLGARIGYRF